MLNISHATVCTGIDRRHVIAFGEDKSHSITLNDFGEAMNLANSFPFPTLRTTAITSIPDSTKPAQMWRLRIIQQRAQMVGKRLLPHLLCRPPLSKHSVFCNKASHIFNPQIFTSREPECAISASNNSKRSNRCRGSHGYTRLGSLSTGNSSWPENFEIEINFLIGPRKTFKQYHWPKQWRFWIIGFRESFKTNPMSNDIA